MRKYEIMYIIDSVTTDEAKVETMAAVEKILTGAGAKELSTEKWGDRKLAYPIEKKTTGYYVLTTFEIEGTELTEVERILNITEEVMRYIIVKQN